MRKSLKSICQQYNVRISYHGRHGVGLHGFLADIRSAIAEIQDAARSTERGKYFEEHADTGIYLSR